MNQYEVFKQITSEHKWYAPFMSAQAAFLFKKRFVNGELKQSTIKKFFAKFGYEQNEITWEKNKIFINHDPNTQKLSQDEIKEILNCDKSIGFYTKQNLHQ